MAYPRPAGEHRKRKLLEKQKEGKKRMKSIGKVNIPPSRRMGLTAEGGRASQEAFIQVLKSN